MERKPLRAIDLYAGVGGWSFGLMLAGFEIVKSYERWAAANETNEANNGHPTCTTDIRTMELDDLPDGIDVVVGSPPCIEFSFSNRGGRGDIRDGLEDVKRFLTVVDRLKPRWWVMENVPRVAAILERELTKGGELASFRHLNVQTTILRMEEFALPQRRRRCLAGNIDFDRLLSYRSKAGALTLGDIVRALGSEKIVDPIYGFTLADVELSDHEPEADLTEEELRINRSAKELHPVYNAMAFPDPLDKPVRTITAICTRVSRESVIIADLRRQEAFRRLTVRERASLQGFPITYKFYASTYSHKLRMIGNAVPPLLSFYVGLAILGVPSEEAPSLRQRASTFLPPPAAPARTPPHATARRYPPHRRFRFAIPQLRLKSGVRFELVNYFGSGGPQWRVDFYFGTSKSIHVLAPNAELCEQAVVRLPDHLRNAADVELRDLEQFLAHVDFRRMQEVWSHRGPGGTRPFDVLDRLGTAGAALTDLLSTDLDSAVGALASIIDSHFGPAAGQLSGLTKLQRNAAMIVAGVLVGTLLNRQFADRTATSRRAEGHIAV